MSDTFEYPFRIIGPKPNSLPMSRLADYMSELARFLGSTRSVYFDRIEDRSVSIIAVAPIEELPVISPRIRSAASGDPEAEAAAPWQKLNILLSEDGWTAEMYLPKGGEVIAFPGREKAAKAIRSVVQQTSIQGRLVRIEGAGKQVKVGLDIDGGLAARISIPAEQARQMASFFQQYVRLSGEGRWKRSDEGVWSLDHLSATAFEALDDVSLSEALDRLKRILPEGSGASIMQAVDELRRA